MVEGFAKILIVITSGPSVLTDYKGVSAAAWSLTLPQVLENGLGPIGKGGTEVSDTAESNESEAAMMALNAALREVVDGSEVRVFVSQDWIATGINGGAESWEVEEWKNRPNSQYWKEFLAICRTKSLSVFGEKVAASDCRVAGDFRVLRKFARQARDTRSKDLGTPNSGFDPVE